MACIGAEGLLWAGNLKQPVTLRTALALLFGTGGPTLMHRTRRVSCWAAPVLSLSPNFPTSSLYNTTPLSIFGSLLLVWLTGERDPSCRGDMSRICMVFIAVLAFRSSC